MHHKETIIPKLIRKCIWCKKIPLYPNPEFNRMRRGHGRRRRFPTLSAAVGVVAGMACPRRHPLPFASSHPECPAIARPEQCRPRPWPRRGVLAGRVHGADAAKSMLTTSFNAASFSAASQARYSLRATVFALHSRDLHGIRQAIVHGGGGDVLCVDM